MTGAENLRRSACTAAKTNMAAVFAKRLTRLILVSISQNEPFIFGLLSDEASIPQNEEFRVRSPCIEEFALSSGRILRL